MPEMASMSHSPLGSCRGVLDPKIRSFLQVASDPRLNDIRKAREHITH